MFRCVAACALLAVAALAAPNLPDFNPENIPAEFKELIPKEAKELFSKLTDEDKAILKELGARHSEFKTEEEFLAALKAKSAKLGEQAEKAHNLVKEKLSALGAEAKAFATELIGEARKIHAAFLAGTIPNKEDLKAKARATIEKYKALSEDAKADLAKNFPISDAFLKNPKVQEIANKILAAN